MKRAVVLLVAAAIMALPALAHELRPAYLQLRQSGVQTYEMTWRVPGLGDDLRLGIQVQLPPGCTSVTPPLGAMANGAYTERSTMTCAAGLTGGTVRIEGLDATSTDVLVRLERLDGTTQVTRLTPSAPSFVVEAVPGPFEVARTYLELGVEHILTGVDHLLFVLALLFLVRGRRRLVGAVTAFTVAHSITLAGATIGVVHVPVPPAEAAIALSILFLAMEIVRDGRGAKGLMQRSPWIVAFIFGLLHGFGFASALNEIGLPQTAVPIALLCFNAGVEVGQLFFIACVLGLLWLCRRVAQGAGWAKPTWASRIPPYVIGSVASFWLIQRIAAF